MKNLKYIFLSLLFALSLNGYAVNWVITDEGATIKVVHFSNEVYNSPKSDTQSMAVPSRTGGNTSGVDKLYIGNDNSYTCQIAWNDVIVDGVAPSDLEDLENKVSTILNNVSDGLQSPITSGYETFISRIGAATIVAGQVYLVDNSEVTQLPTGIDYILVTGLAGEYSPIVQAHITALNILAEGGYDAVDNLINVELRTLIRVTQTGNANPVLTVVKNDLTGVTFNGNYSDVGSYTIGPSISLSLIFNYIMFQVSGTQVVGEDIIAPFAFVGSYYDEVNDVARFGTQVLTLGTLTPTDGILNSKTFTLTCILSN